jgi:hypothetical protein
MPCGWRRAARHTASRMRAHFDGAADAIRLGLRLPAYRAQDARALHDTPEAARRFPATWRDDGGTPPRVRRGGECGAAAAGAVARDSRRRSGKGMRGRGREEAIWLLAEDSKGTSSSRIARSACAIRRSSRIRAEYSRNSSRSIKMLCRRWPESRCSVSHVRAALVISPAEMTKI